MLKQLALGVAFTLTEGCASLPFSRDMIPRLHEVEENKTITAQQFQFTAQMGLLSDDTIEQLRILGDLQFAYYIAAQVEMAKGNSEEASQYLNKMQDATEAMNIILNALEINPLSNPREMF